MHILADYIVTVAAPSQSKGEVEDMADGTESAGSSLPLQAWSNLRRGAHALYGACSATEVFAMNWETAKSSFPLEDHFGSTACLSAILVKPQELEIMLQAVKHQVSLFKGWRAWNYTCHTLLVKLGDC